jgi:amidase
MDVVEASIEDALNALQSGKVTSVDLTALALDRIAFYDRQHTALNACPVLNGHAFEEAQASDAARKAGQARPLEGIPYTTKDSYSVKGLTVANGSPAFQDLVATKDAFVIEKLREAGAVLLAKTNMVCLAAGGMQRGIYGRAESCYKYVDGYRLLSFTPG